MILDTKNERIDQVHLTKKEYKFLATLVSNELVQPEAMFEFVFGRKAEYRPKIVHDLSVIKNRLQKKIRLNIENRSNIGYILKNTIQVI